MKNKAFITLILYASLFSLSVYAQDTHKGSQDTRQGNIDAYILIDRNIPMSGAREDQIDWLCTTLVDSILKNGDRVTVWTLDGKLSQIAKIELNEGTDKEFLKKAIRNISSSLEEPDYSAGLRAVSAAEAARPDRSPIAFALLAASMTREDELILEKEDIQSARLLRFSRVIDHPGWKAITVGLGIEPKARAAAAAFMDESFK